MTDKSSRLKPSISSNMTCGQCGGNSKLLYIHDETVLALCLKCDNEEYPYTLAEFEVWAYSLGIKVTRKIGRRIASEYEQMEFTGIVIIKEYSND